MKTLSLALSIVGFFLVSHAASEQKDDSFQLKVEEVLQNSGCRVIRLKVSARSADMVLLREDHGGSLGSHLTSSADGKSQEGTIVLAAMLGEDSKTCHTTTTVQSSFNPVTYDMTSETKPESVFSLTITNGIYKLNRPLGIGKRNGDIMRLTVGKWNQ